MVEAELPAGSLWTREGSLAGGVRGGKRVKLAALAAAVMASCDGDVTQWRWERSGAGRKEH